MVDYLSSQPDWAGYQVSTEWGSGPNYGQDQLAKVNYLAEEDHNKADQETGRPAFYDNAIPTEYEHSIGIRKDPMK